MKKRTLQFGSLFSGIGGFDLGLERAGMECVWQVENDPYAIKVLEKHWPDVRRRKDVRKFPKGDLEKWQCDLICGGFPCQPVSLAGKRKGTADERWLWPEFARIIRVLRPRFALLENVPGLLSSEFGRVLSDLAESRYDAEWEVLPASAFGSFHNRDRVFVCAYGQGSVSGVFANSRKRWRRQFQSRRLAAHQAVARWPGQRFEGEPDVAVLVDGVPSRMGKGFGNAIVPQVAEWIGRRIMEV